MRNPLPPDFLGRRPSIGRVVLGILTLGVIIVANTVADEPKEKVARGITFNEKVTVRVWVERQKMFANPHEGVWARRRQDAKKGLIIDVLGASVATSIPTKGSELTDKDGNVYTCTEVEGEHPATCFVKLKQAAKKP